MGTITLRGCIRGGVWYPGLIVDDMKNSRMLQMLLQNLHEVGRSCFADLAFFFLDNSKMHC